MSDYKGPDNIYWLFSSSAQAIAAFIGFLAAGFFFSFDRMDKQVDKDETLEEIYAEIKKQYYSRIITLFILTGSSIILSLSITFLNGFDLKVLGIIIKIFVSLLNIVTIIWAIVFILYIIDPSKVKKTADKLIKANENISDEDSILTITRGQFIDKFIELEKLLRQLAEKHQLFDDTNINVRMRTTMPLYQIIQELNLRQIINRNQFNELLEVNKVRNLAAHGEINNVESKLGDWVDRIVVDLKDKVENKKPIY
jgi:hypothetical protein